MLEFKKNPIYDNYCKSTYPHYPSFPVLQRVLLSYYWGVFMKKSIALHCQILISGTIWSITSKFYEVICWKAFYVTKTFHWRGKKDFLTVMENKVHFPRSTWNVVYYLFFNIFFSDNFLGFWVVNNFETL